MVGHDAQVKGPPGWGQGRAGKVGEKNGRGEVGWSICLLQSRRLLQRRAGEIKRRRKPIQKIRKSISAEKRSGAIFFRKTVRAEKRDFELFINRNLKGKRQDFALFFRQTVKAASRAFCTIEANKRHRRANTKDAVKRERAEKGREGVKGGVGVGRPPRRGGVGGPPRQIEEQARR